MNGELFELLRWVEEGARRLAATIVHCYDKPIKDTELAVTDLEDITAALNSFKAHVAAGERVGAVPGRLVRNDGGGLTWTVPVKNLGWQNPMKSFGQEPRP